MSRRIILPFVIVAISFIIAGSFNTHSQQPKSGAKPLSGNVRDNGAKGDGIADDWQIIQNTVDAGASAIILPSGTYRITKTVTVDLSKGGFTSIRGGGVARVVMAGVGPAFQFKGSHQGTADPKTFKDNVWNRERMPSVDGIEIVGDNPAADGIEASGTMQLTLTRLLIRKCRHGVHLTGRDRNVIISDSHIYQNRGIGIFLDATLNFLNIFGIKLRRVLNI